MTPVASAQIVARFDDGAPALVERRIGSGRVMVWTSTLDLQWSDFPSRPCSCRFLHRVATSLASYAERPPG